MKFVIRLVVVGALVALMAAMTGCGVQNKATSNSGVAVGVASNVKPGADGLTTEQRNIAARNAEENDPLAIKYIYVISPYTGDILIYSSVKGKVTSSGKRLTPSTVERVWNVFNWDTGTGSGNENNVSDGFMIPWGKQGAALTKEAPGDDGTWGPSVEYLYWYDLKGVYHQQYPQGCIINVSSQPIGVKKAIINYENIEADGAAVPSPHAPTPSVPATTTK